MKLSKERKKAIIKMVENGLSLPRAAQATGIHRSTADKWKKEDPEFEREIEAAEARFIQKMTDLITAAAVNDWRAAAELLRRRFPEDFGIPEKRIALQQINNTVNVSDRSSADKARNSPAYARAIAIEARRLSELHRNDPSIRMPAAFEIEALAMK
jgi:hypothetical protein